jgi:hypothetical protein
VCIASQVFEDMLGAAEGRPGVDHPVQSLELAVEPIEHRRLFPRSEQAAKADFVYAIMSRAATLPLAVTRPVPAGRSPQQQRSDCYPPTLPADSSR